MADEETLTEMETREIAFTPEEFREAARDFRGVIVRAEYNTPWTIENSPFAETQKIPQMRIQIRPTDQPIKDQYEWYAPTNIKNTRWYYFIKALNDLGVVIQPEGNTLEERINDFCKKLIGLEFQWKDHQNLPGLRPGRIIQRLLLPVRFYGKREVKPETGVTVVQI